MQQNAKPLPVACFAPPLSDELLASYRQTIEALGPDQAELKDALTELLVCCEKWWELPESTRRGQTLSLLHRGKNVDVEIKPLEEQHVKSLWDYVPWMRELTAMEPLFESLPNDAAGKPLRDMAFHLLWHAKEITLDREPLTADKLPA